MSIKDKIQHQKLTLDVNQSDCFSTLEMKQGDKLSRFVDVTLTASGEFINLNDIAEGTTAKIIASMDGELRQNSIANINSDGTVTVELDENALGEAGVLDCEIRITDSNDAVLSSALFLIRVGRSAAGKAGKIVDVLKGIVSPDMCNEELLSGIVPVLLSPDEKAEKYSNLLLNVGDNTVFIAHPAYWNDVPSSETGVFVNRHYSASYDIQLYVELTSGNFYTRIVDSASSGEASVYRDWLSVETHAENIIKMNIKQSVLVTTTNGVLAKINDNVVFSCSVSQGWSDMPTSNGGVFTNQRYGTNYNIQYFVQQSTGYMWTRIVDRRTGKPYRDWIDIVDREWVADIVRLNLEPDETASTYSNLLLNVGDNTIFMVHPTYWSDAPSSEGGVFINRHYSASYDIQVYVELTSGKMYTRIVDSAASGSASVYRDWICAETHAADIVKMCVKQSALATECGGLLSNIKDNIIMSCSVSSGWTDKPTTAGSVFINWRYGTNYNLQLDINQNTGVIWRRVVNRNTGAVFNDWKQPDGTPLMNILALGDSICRGVRNSEKGFVGDLGFPYKNIGVSSATISNVTTSVMNIPDQILNLKTTDPDYTPDIIIGEGGINDWSKGAFLGTLSDVPVTTDEQAEALDRSTVIGGLEYLLYKMISFYPKAQRFFLITHKTWKTNASAYCPTTQNSAGWTQQDLHDAIVECCELYNVKVIDVYKDSLINSLFDCYRSDVAYNSDNSKTNTEYVDYDGVHPMAYGYKEGYVPIVRKAIGIGTKK